MSCLVATRRMHVNEGPVTINQNGRDRRNLTMHTYYKTGINHMFFVQIVIYPSSTLLIIKPRAQYIKSVLNMYFTMIYSVIKGN